MSLATGRLDVAGFVLAGGGLALFLYTVSESPVRGWASPVIIAAGVASVALLAALALVELRSAAPMLNLRLLGNRIFRTSSLTVGLDTNIWLIRLLIFCSGFAIPWCGIATQTSSFATISSADTGRAAALFQTQGQISSRLSVMSRAEPAQPPSRRPERYPLVTLPAISGSRAASISPFVQLSMMRLATSSPIALLSVVNDQSSTTEVPSRSIRLADQAVRARWPQSASVTWAKRGGPSARY